MLTRIAVRRGASLAHSRAVLAYRPLPRPATVALASASRPFSWTPWRPTPAAPVALAAPVDHEPASAIALSSVETPPALSDAAALTSTPLSSTSLHTDPASLLPQPPADAVTPTLADLLASGRPIDEVLNSPEAVHAALKVADLKVVGLDHSFYSLPGWVADALVGMHTTTGLPWWASIAALTVGVRMCLFPLIVRNMKHNQRLAAVSPQMQALMKRAQEAKLAGDTQAQTVAALALQDLFKTHDVSPLRPLTVPLLQLPFFLSMFYGLRRLAELPLPQLKEGGFAWVTDLTAADPYYILPATSIALQLLVFRTGVDGTSASSNAGSARTMGHLRNFFIMTSPLTIWFLSGFPSAVLFYWTFANAFTLIQATALKSPSVRSFLSIPQQAPQTSLPPVPGTAAVNPNPTFLETIRVPQQWHSDTLGKVYEAQAAAREAAAERERATGQRAGTAQIFERVNETRVAPALPAAPAASGGFLEPEAAAPAQVQGAVSRELAKKRRVEAARAKRQKQ
ncbi:hypothetical protein Q5752_000831 [Cryptotrichosporon argae]